MPSRTLSAELSEADVSNSSSLWIAASDGELELVREILSSGGPNNSPIDPNTQDEAGYTAMHAAASYSHKEVIELLISKGADVNKTDFDGDAPLHVVETVEVCSSTNLGLQLYR
jgi:ankyrin repeat protein